MEDLPACHPDKVIRKLRKKLRQIEHLELLERELNEEEIHKVNQKRSIRKELQDLIKHQSDDLEIMKRPGSMDQSQTECDLKKVKRASVPSPCQSSVEAPLEINGSTNIQSHLPYENKAKPKPSRKNVLNEDEDTHTGTCKWRDGCFEVLTLQGHNDLVLAVDCFEDYILSASRDTTVRVWRVGKTEEERSLRGHTGSVTDVSFLPSHLALAVTTKLEADAECSFPQGGTSDGRILALSGGLDCTLKVWNVTSGENLASIYTYNGITCLGCGSWGVVTGTEGGRLEFWCLISQQRITFLDAFDSRVTSVHVKKNEVYGGSWEGELGVWGLDPGRKTLTTKYILERTSVPRLSLKQLSAVAEHQGKCYLGDGGANIKVLDWKKNEVSRLKNHRADVGMSDSLSVTPDGFLLAASFHVDSGRPSINVRDLQSGQYLCSLIDQDEGRYLTLSSASNIVVAGGHLLKVWIHREKSISQTNEVTNSTGKVTRPVFFHNLTTDAVDSEEDTDWASSSEDEEGSRLPSGTKRVNEDQASNWWCSIL